MNGRNEIERTLDGFLAEGPETVADQAFMRALDAVDRTKQRRDLLAPWRLSLMSINSRLATVMLVAAIAIGGGAYFLGQRAAVGTGPATPTASPAAPNPTPSAVALAPTPEPTVDTTFWSPFTSRFYGFTVSRPQTWTEGRGTGHWTLANQDDAAVDVLWSPTGWPDFKGYETKIPAGMTADAFIQAYTADATKTACYPTPNMWTQTTIDGHPATIAYAGCNEHFYFAQATVVIGNRIWLFDLDGPDRLLIVPFLSTVKIDPTKVVD
jgi:hypothetical protein